MNLYLSIIKSMLDYPMKQAKTIKILRRPDAYLIYTGATHPQFPPSGQAYACHEPLLRVGLSPGSKLP
jgi:hypothetical protein